MCPHPLSPTPNQFSSPHGSTSQLQNQNQNKPTATQNRLKITPFFPFQIQFSPLSFVICTQNQCPPHKLFIPQNASKSPHKTLPQNPSPNVDNPLTIHTPNPPFYLIQFSSPLYCANLNNNPSPKTPWFCLLTPPPRLLPSRTTAAELRSCCSHRRVLAGSASG